MDERNARRNANLEYLSAGLECLGFKTFRPPPHLRRVYFEYLVGADEQRLGMPLSLLAEALRAEGCDVHQPRYPLLQQQPFFTEGAFREVLRLPADVPMPCYRPDALPRTEAANRRLIRLPAFPRADKPLLDQYVHAFDKVLRCAREVGNAAAAGRLPRS